MEKSPEEIRLKFLKSEAQKADIVNQYAIISLFLMGIFLGYYYDTYQFALIVGSISLFIFYITKWFFEDQYIHPYVLSTSYAFFVVQFIYQTHGIFEFYFLVFICSALLVNYKNWKILFPMFIVIVIHQGALVFLQNFSSYNHLAAHHTTIQLSNFVYHILFVFIAMGIYMYRSYIILNISINDIVSLTKLKDTIMQNQKCIDFAEEITKGNLKSSLIPKDSNDKLAYALLTMQESLKKISQSESDVKYLNKGLAQINEILRQNNDFKKQFDNLTTKITHYVNGVQTGLFLVENDFEESETRLNLVSHYAYDRNKYSVKSILPSEGLIGQAYLEKDSFHVTNLPEDYPEVGSGLGLSAPKELYIMPLIFNDEVLGVIEVASFYKITDLHILYLKRIALAIGENLSSYNSIQKTNFLLEQSIKQKELMDVQGEEMKLNLQELSLKQDEIIQKENETRAISEMYNSILGNSPGALYRSKIDANWTMVYISPKVKDLLGYSSEEFMKHQVHLGKITLKEDVLYVEEKVSYALKNNTRYELFYRLVHKSGKIVKVWEIGEGIYDPISKEIMIEGLIVDIGNLKIENEMNYKK